MPALRSVLMFFLSTAALTLILLANLSGANTPFFRTLYLSKLEGDDGSAYYWTLYNFCSLNATAGDVDFTCTPSQAAYPYEPYDWSNNWQAVDNYKSGSQAGYALVLASLVFLLVCFVSSIVIFFRRESIWDSLFSIFSLISTFVNLVAAIIETGLHRNGSVIISGSSPYSAGMGNPIQALLWIPVFLIFGSSMVAILMVDERCRDDLESEKGSRRNPFLNPKREAL
ncbi:hypothetical protein JCM33374_g2941 [Metschnikowia sp. JCM 33374]|nr:hypothetical protein JCM33374_g2941 [Metschnikowia sp. JCM 33374]